MKMAYSVRGRRNKREDGSRTLGGMVFDGEHGEEIEEHREVDIGKITDEEEGTGGKKE